MGCTSSSNAKPLRAKDTDAARTSNQFELEMSNADDKALYQSQGAAVSEHPAKDVTIYLVYYSTYGHVEALVRKMEEAIMSTGVKTKCWRVRKHMHYALSTAADR
jgi:biotin carboxylase